MTSLAYVQSTKLWATAFAGINSSTAEQQKGKNEHLRSFLLEFPPLRNAADDNKVPKDQGVTKALGKVSYFKPSSASPKETFQRVLRLSKKKKDNGPRLGAVATGLAPEGEIVLFKADTNRPGKDDIHGRVTLGPKEEAADVDIVELDDAEGDEARFRVVYCTDYDIFVMEVNYSQKTNGSESRCVLSTPHPDAFASSKSRPKFRCIRFVTPKVLLVLQNKPNGTGSELLLLELSGKITLRKKLHKKIKSATALSIAHLDASSPSEIDQHAIAVAGADTSITIITLDRFLSYPQGKVKFRSHSSLPSVHPTSITSLSFSVFHPPTTNWNATPAQYLKLASTSIANTCVVHTFSLSPYPSPPKPDTPARYLLITPGRSNLAQNTISTLVAVLAIAIGAFFLQAFTEIRGGTPEYLGAKGWLSERVHGWIARPYMFEDGYVSGVANQYSSSLSDAREAAATPIHIIKSATTGTQQKLGLRELLAHRNVGSDTADNANDGHAIIVRNPSGADGANEALSADLIPEKDVEKEEEKAKRWEELTEQEKETWKKRLTEAGHWTASEGEAVLKGVFFSGLANIVGGIVGG